MTLRLLLERADGTTTDQKVAFVLVQSKSPMMWCIYGGQKLRPKDSEPKGLMHFSPAEAQSDPGGVVGVVVGETWEVERGQFYDLVRFLCQVKKSAVPKLIEAYGDETLSCTHAFEWNKQFSGNELARRPRTYLSTTFTNLSLSSIVTLSSSDLNFTYQRRVARSITDSSPNAVMFQAAASPL
ncbi:hypothetical protein TNCV_2434691 [Trichonephila clavipes]|nr:hypothetical protein TNCV_2434691 [Trichonephila clavipes]